MPSRIVALEPERKVGSTAAAQAIRRGGNAHSCLTGDDPYLKFRVEGFQSRIEHNRRSRYTVYQHVLHIRCELVRLEFQLLA